MTRPAFRVDAVLVQAVIAGALSFAHLHDLAAAAGQGGWKAWAYPISVDLLLVASWRRLRSDGPSRLAWCWFLIALVASLGANVATAGLLDLHQVPAWLSILVAAWPALAFMGGTLLAHSTGDHPAPEAPATTAGREPVASAEPEPTPPAVAENEDTPTLPAAESAPAPKPAAAAPTAPAVPVPAALVDHARKVAADHRARTGSPIDTDTLRARLGVPPQLAHAIAAQLA